MERRPDGGTPAVWRSSRLRTHVPRHKRSADDRTRQGLDRAAARDREGWMSRVRQHPGTDLQHELRDLLCLAVVGDHVRWVVVDDDGELAAWLAEAVPAWRALADEVATHLVALGVPPDGRVRSLAEDIPLNWVPDGWLRADHARRLLNVRLHIAASWARQRRSQASDPASAELLAEVSARLGRFVGAVVGHAAARTTGAR